MPLERFGGTFCPVPGEHHGLCRAFWIADIPLLVQPVHRLPVKPLPRPGAGLVLRGHEIEQRCQRWRKVF